MAGVASASTLGGLALALSVGHAGGELVYQYDAPSAYASGAGGAAEARHEEEEEDGDEDGD
ncbi:MAG: hypothetical protein R3F59_19940 [Myxococcota bacterium]